MPLLCVILDGNVLVNGTNTTVLTHKLTSICWLNTSITIWSCIIFIRERQWLDGSKQLRWQWWNINWCQKDFHKYFRKFGNDNTSSGRNKIPTTADDTPNIVSRPTSKKNRLRTMHLSRVQQNWDENNCPHSHPCLCFPPLPFRLLKNRYQRTVS